MDINEIISSGLLELYATGLASAEETLQVQQWAANYPEVADELKKIEDSIEMYAQSNGETPPAYVKDKVFLRINETDKAKIIPLPLNGEVIESETATRQQPVIISSFWRNVAAAVGVILVGSLITNIVLVNRNKTTTALLENTRQSLAVLAEQHKEIEQDMAVVKNKFSTSVSLTGLAPAPDAAAKVFWMKNTGDVFFDPSNLPQTPQGKRYELWAIVDGKPVNAGVVLTSKTGDKYRIQKMKSFGKVEAFAVSLEDIKEQPATTPTQVYVMGKL